MARSWGKPLYHPIEKIRERHPILLPVDDYFSLVVIWELPKARQLKEIAPVFQ
jgi:hypothetical protein